MNGWKNRETWLANLHFADLLNDIADENKELSTYELSRTMKKYIEEMIDEDMQNMPIYIQDFMGDWKINWYEIAEHYKVN